MTTAMGLALAIDYSLFIVSRYREEVRGGAEPDDAIRTTMRTAGRTVLFSALTVGLSLAAMLVFPVYFLRSFAYAGIAVVGARHRRRAAAAAGAAEGARHRASTRSTCAPSCAGCCGRPAPVVKPVEQTFWYRFANAVMRRALPVGLLVTAILVALGLPFLHAQFGYPDDHVVPKSEAVHQVGDDLRTQLHDQRRLDDHHRRAATSRPTPPQLDSYADALSGSTGVTSVSAAAGTYVDGRQVAAGAASMTIGQRDLPRPADRRGRADRPRPRPCCPTLRARAGAVARAVHRPDRDQPGQPARPGRDHADRDRA